MWPVRSWCDADLGLCSILWKGDRKTKGGRIGSFLIVQGQEMELSSLSGKLLGDLLCKGGAVFMICP